MLLEAILGTRTKIRMLACLMEHPEGLTRKRLADLSQVSHRAVYEQIKDLEFLEIVIKKKNHYHLNETHFLYHALLDILQMGLLHEQLLEEKILEFIHQHLGTNYYIGGFLAATRNITLMDYHVEIIHVGVVKKYHEEAITKFKILNSHHRVAINEFVSGKMTLYFFKTSKIPPDVLLEDGVYQASLSRGVIECFILPGLTPYGQVLTFMENLKENLLDVELMAKIVQEFTTDDIPDTHQLVNFFVFLEALKDFFIDTSRRPGWLDDGKTKILLDIHQQGHGDPKLKETYRRALQNVLGTMIGDEGWY